MTRNVGTDLKVVSTVINHAILTGSQRRSGNFYQIILAR
jgi:hypothetical protein